MFKAIAIIMACFVSAQAGIPKDKLQHFAVGAAVGLSVSYTAKRLGSKHPVWWGIGAGVAAGAGKELYDRRHAGHSPELNDALATAAGAAVVQVRFAW